jgi:phage FluMu protein Com
MTVTPVEFLCEHCGTKLRTPDGSTGKKTKCPKCEVILTIPEPSVASQPQTPPSFETPTPQSSPFTTPAHSTTPAQRSQPEASEEWQGFENFPNVSGFNETGNPWQAPADLGPEPSESRLAVVSGRVSGDKLGFSQAFDMTYETLKSNFLSFFVLGRSLLLIGFVYL